MANELHTFTGNEVIATELPELLNQNFDYVRENSLKSVNGVGKDENNNVDVTFLTSQVIPTNSDLNNFRESGEYTREVDTVVVTNSPTEKPFFLTVLASENLVKQVVTEIDRKDPMTFTRTLSGANWSPWVEGGVDIGIWKSEETVKVGDVRFLKGRENAGYVLECVTAGVTGENQPVLEGNVAEEVFDLNNFDGTLSIEKGGIGATKLIRKKNAFYDIGDVVYNETNGKVALKCTTTGTTSNSVLDVSNKNIGDTVTDGGVVWQVVSRDLSDSFANYLPLSGGEMTGGIQFLNNGYVDFIDDATNNFKYLAIGSADWNKGSRLHLFNNDSVNSSGAFEVAATSNSGSHKVLFGSSDGSFTWDGRQVLTSYGSFAVEETTGGGTLYIPIGGTWNALIFTTQSNGNYAWVNVYWNMAGGSPIQIESTQNKAVMIAFKTA